VTCLKLGDICSNILSKTQQGKAKPKSGNTPTLPGVPPLQPVVLVLFI